MKNHKSIQRRPARLAGFTLPETMITMGIFVMVLGGVMGAYLYGMKMVEFTKPKLGASEEARQALNKLTHEIRSAKVIRLGNGNLSRFDEVGVNTRQQGSAIQIYPSNNTNQWIRYFWEASDQKLKRTTNGTTAVSIVATCISNAMVFTSEDCFGNVITNNQNNRVIGLTLQFYQIQYPITPIGDGHYYDFYQLRTRVTRRSLF